MDAKYGVAVSEQVSRDTNKLLSLTLRSLLGLAYYLLIFESYISHLDYTRLEMLTRGTCKLSSLSSASLFSLA